MNLDPSGNARPRWGAHAALALLFLAAPNVARAAACPNVQFVINRSASMQSKWLYATDAVNAFASAQLGLGVGLTLFPTALNVCDAETPVRPAPGTQAAIAAALAAKTPRGSTSTTAGLRGASQLSELRDASRGQYLVLSTDGAPGCAQSDTADTAVAELDSARQRTPPVFTFVVGLRLYNSAHAATLTRLADAGGRAAATAERFYRAESPFELQAALDAITARILAENPGCVSAANDMMTDVLDGGALPDQDAGKDGGAGSGGCACDTTRGGASPPSLLALMLVLAALARTARALSERPFPHRPALSGRRGERGRDEK